MKYIFNPLSGLFDTVGGSSKPAGSDTYVQFNDGGDFGGVDAFTFDKNTNTLSVPTLTLTTNLVVPSISGVAGASFFFQAPNGTGVSGAGADAQLLGGSGSSTDGNGGHVILAPGAEMGTGTRGRILFQDIVSGRAGEFDTTTLTGERHYYLPDADGTLALAADFVLKTGGAMSGILTMTNGEIDSSVTESTTSVGFLFKSAINMAYDIDRLSESYFTFQDANGVDRLRLDGDNQLIIKGEGRPGSSTLSDVMVIGAGKNIGGGSYRYPGIFITDGTQFVNLSQSAITTRYDSSDDGALRLFFGASGYHIGFGPYDGTINMYGQVAPYATINTHHGLNIAADDATAKVVMIRGFTSQSGSLTEWQNVSSVVLAKVDSTGNFFISNTAPEIDLTDTGGSKTWKMQVTNTGNDFILLSPNGAPLIDASNGDAITTINLTATPKYNGAVALTVKGVSSQSANLQEWQSNTTLLAAVDPTGAFKPAHLADSAAPNDSYYYSTTASKFVYKDSGGVVNNLY